MGATRNEISDSKAIAHSLVIATLHQGQDGVGRVQIRAIDYVDTLIKNGDVWKIEKRIHQPTMQYDALSQRKVLY
jgi:hypothetical protein